MTTPKYTTTKSQLTQGSNITTTPVAQTQEDLDDQKIDLMAEINEIIQLALGKKRIQEKTREGRNEGQKLSNDGKSARNIAKTTRVTRLHGSANPITRHVSLTRRVIHIINDNTNKGSEGRVTSDIEIRTYKGP